MQRRWTLEGRALGGRVGFVRRSDLTAKGETPIATPAQARAHVQAALAALADRDGAGRAAAIEMLVDCGLARVDLARLGANELARWLGNFLERGQLVMLAPGPPDKSGGGGSADPAQPDPVPKPAPRPRPTGKPKKVLSIKWAAQEGWCSEDTSAEGTTENYPDDETVEVKVQQQGGPAKGAVQAKVAGNGFTVPWTIKNILPVKAGAHLAPELKLDAEAAGQTTPKPLAVKFITRFDKVAHVDGRAHFDLSMTDNEALVESDIKFVQGWAGQVVKLGNKVPAATGGLLDGLLTWSGYRWMKNDGADKKYWDGAAWQALTATFVLRDGNHFSVGFYKQGTGFTCQYGGTWPEAFSEWSIDAPDKQSTITSWTNNIKTTWTGKFDLKRKECKSSDKKCCRYSTRAVVTFSKQAAFAGGMLIIADGNIRSNDSLLFLGETRVAVAAHEFGHHLGNPDEYPTPGNDTSLNGDGAVNGIDADSIMGQNLTKVKARHYREIIKVFSSAVSSTFGKSYNYLAVPP